MKTISGTISHELYTELENISKNLGMSHSEVIRIGLEMYFERRKMEL